MFYIFYKPFTLFIVDNLELYETIENIRKEYYMDNWFLFGQVMIDIDQENKSLIKYNEFKAKMFKRIMIMTNINFIILLIFVMKILILNEWC